MPTEKAHGVAVAKMCAAFADAGSEVELLVPMRKGILDKNPFEYYGVRGNFKIKYLPCVDFLSSRWIPKKIAFLIESRSFGFSVKKYLAENRPDVVYSRDEFVLKKIFGSKMESKLFWELHAIPKNWNLYARMAAEVSGFVVLTSAMKKMLLARGIADEKILVSPDAVDLKSFEISKSKDELRQELRLPAGVKLVTYVGQLEALGKERGISGLISAFKIVESAYPNAALCLVGGPKERILKYQTDAAKIGLTKVIFIDYIEPKAVPAYELASDVLVIPFPRTERYAHFVSPLKMFEYMAAGVPIVTTDLPAIRDVLDEKTAVIVRPDDPADMARGILKLLRDEEAAVFLAGNAKESVKNYSWEERVKKILNFINLASSAPFC